MIEVKFLFDTIAAAQQFLTGVSDEAQPAAKPRRGKKAAAEEPTPAGAGAAAADPLAGMLAPQAPVMVPPAAGAILGGAALPPMQTPIATATAVEQKDLIAAFTTLGKTKGRDAIANALVQLGAKAVIGPEGLGIPQARWGEAVALVNQVLGS
jgi:hypothetical protein